MRTISDINPSRNSASIEHIACLDGLRALAIISVWAIHAGVPGSTFGWLGVDLFFVLSGFLITTLMVKELEFRLSRSKSAIAVRLANSSQEQQWSLATSYQTQP